MLRKLSRWWRLRRWRKRTAGEWDDGLAFRMSDIFAKVAEDVTGVRPCPYRLSMVCRFINARHHAQARNEEMFDDWLTMTLVGRLDTDSLRKTVIELESLNSNKD